MSYTKAGNHLQYFAPLMVIAGNSTKPLCAINIAAANATHGEFICVVPCIVRTIKATVVLLTVSTSTVPVITLKKYTAPLAGGSATTVGTISIPDATAVGKVVYKDNLSVAFNIGDVMQIAWTLGTGGSVAGEAVVDWYCESNPEVAANNTDMIASA